MNMVKISLKLEQRIKLSQMQRLTIRLMRLRGRALEDFLNEQIVENPLLDIRYPDVRTNAGAQSEGRPVGNIRGSSDSVEEKLMKELRLQNAPKKVILAAGLVIQSLDEKGFFAAALEEIGVEYGLSLADMEAGLALVQSFDPPGIAARSIREGLLIQTRRNPAAPAGTEALLVDHYDDFLHGRWQKLSRDLGISELDLAKIRNFLKTLSLQPIAAAEEETAYVRADVEILRKGDTVTAQFLELLPEVSFRDDLYAAYARDGDAETRQFIKKAKRQFMDLHTALAYRRQSIATVVQYMIDVQKEYFLGEKSLRPLSQKGIAAATGLSAATVSRVCRDRYALFNGKIYPFQSFLAQGYPCSRDGSRLISDEAIMKEMARLIAGEEKDRPWSDQELAEHFSRLQIQIARRTIAKFRLKMNIPNSRLRKRLKCMNFSQ